MASESKHGHDGAAGGGGGHGAHGHGHGAVRVDSGDRAFAKYLVEYICGQAMDRLLVSASIRDVTTAIMEKDAHDPLNLYRKQHGNFATLINTGKFDALLRNDNNVLKIHANPLPEYTDVAHLIDEGDYKLLKDTIKAVSDEKRSRGVRDFETVN